MSKTNIAIFASGGGSNARKILEHFRNHPSVCVALVVCNRREAGVLHIAEEYNVPSIIISKSYFYDTNDIVEILTNYKISYIVLAGFLLLVPKYIISRFPKKIINIHPALLPKYGGKGMYGHHVHEAVKDAGDTISGITIHFCNEHYDEGDYIFQTQCTLSPDDTPQDIARKVLALEHQYFAQVIDKVVANTP